MSTNSPRASVAALVVTYGDRAELCVATVRAALVSGANSVLIVLNGTDQHVSDTIAARLAGMPVEFVQLSSNYGSAGGFHTAVSRWHRTRSDEWMWLLDDDNAASAGCLASQLSVARATGAGAVAAVREDASIDRALTGRRPPPPGSFLYFDLISRLRDGGATPARYPLLDYAAYGGLLVSRVIVDQIGYPDPGFVLYEDDTDFTLRITSSGHSLVLDPKAEIDDLDSKWSVPSDAAAHSRSLVFSGNPVRQYYAVRNRVRVDRARCTTLGNLIRFAVNALVYVTAGCLLGLRSPSASSLANFLRACAAGIRGKSGVVPRFSSLQGRALRRLEDA